MQFHGEGKGEQPRELLPPLAQFEAHVSKVRSWNTAWSVPGIFSINKTICFPWLSSQVGRNHMGCSFQHCQPARGRPTGAKRLPRVKIKIQQRAGDCSLLGSKTSFGSLRNMQCTAAWSVILRLLEQKPHLSS